MKNTAIFMICLTMCTCIAFGVLYKVDMHRMTNNEPVVFSTWGEEYSPSEITQSAMNDDIYEDMLYIEIKEESVNPRGLNAQIINNTANCIAYFDYYRLEKKIAGEWCYYDYANDFGTSWNDITYIIEPSAVAEISFYWSDMYGELDTGSYRIVKEYFDNADMSNRVHYLYGEFAVL